MALCMHSMRLGVHGLELWLWTLGFYKSSQGGSVRHLNSAKLLARQSMGSAFYFARLRKHMLRLADSNLVSTDGMERAVERNFEAADIGAVSVVSPTRWLSVIGKPYFRTGV